MAQPAVCSFCLKPFLRKRKNQKRHLRCQQSVEKSRRASALKRLLVKKEEAATPTPARLNYGSTKYLDSLPAGRFAYRPRAAERARIEERIRLSEALVAAALEEGERGHQQRGARAER